MNQWANAQTNGNMFTPSASSHLNPAAMYGGNSTSNGMNATGHFDMSQFQNGGTPTPSFPNQTFHPPSVVPAKRPHDGSGMAGSPPQMSRSQTPSYNLAQQAGGQQFSAPTPYQHLQQPGSNTGTPSPTMSNQQFRQPPQPPRMQNASPSPFPQQQQQQSQQNFGNQMTPGTPQPGNLPQAMQQSQMGGFNQGMGMNAGNMGMSGNSMAPNMSNLAAMSQANAQANSQRMYELKLRQQQEAMRRSGMVPPRALGGQQSGMGNMMGGQMPNGQPMTPVQQNQMYKRQTFLRALQANAQSQGRQFNAQPTLFNKQLDLYMLWNLVAMQNGFNNVERNQRWQMVAFKLGFNPQQFPHAVEEIKQAYVRDISSYERAWFSAKQQQKQEQARNYAHQMAGLGGPTQSSPTRMMQPPNQQSQLSQMQQQVQQAQQQPQATPVQAHAQLQQNGMATPQQMMQHRRNSSVRAKPEQMTPQPGVQGAMAPSPAASVKPQRSPSVKQEVGAVAMRSEEPQSSNYIPNMRYIEFDGGYDVAALFELGAGIAKLKPNMPMVDEMGIIDMRTITLSLASGIHSEVRYALDALATISRDERIGFELEKCEDLIDVIVDCAEEQVELLSEEAAEVSDALDLPSYEDIMRSSRAEAETLQDVPAFGSQAYELDRAADRLIAITTTMRNFSFYEHNHPLLTSAPLIKWLSNTIRLLGTRNMLLRTFYNTLDFYKDIITFLSNITQSLELPSRDDALHILHFLLAFAPQPAPSYAESGGALRFTSFVPTIHRFLPPAVDCLAKLLARQDPNRMLYKSIFSASSSSLAASESPLDLLTRAFALAISVLPDRSKGSLGNQAQLRIVEIRKSYLCQGMLAADILTSLVPGNDAELARAWIESEDGWAVGLLNLAALLSVDRPPPQSSLQNKGLGHDTESFKLITHRALSMMKRLAEKAGKGSSSRAVSNGVLNSDRGEAEAEDGEPLPAPKWEGIPQGHAILGAMMMPNTDKVALGLLCGLHEMAMQ